MAAVPDALRDALASAGVELTGDIEQGARIVVNGVLTPRSRARYGQELEVVSRWGDEHGLDLLNLSALDVAALAVACRDGGCDPDPALTALSFLYRTKPNPQPTVTMLARRVDKVWRAQNRDRLRPRRRAPVLPLPCWIAMHSAVGARGYQAGVHDFDEERVARDRLIISLGVRGGLRPGELRRLSASASKVENGARLVLRLVPDECGSVTKTGRGHIVVPLEAPPFNALPLLEDFTRLQDLRRQRDVDDHLIANGWHRNAQGALSESQVTYLLRKAARHAGIAGGEHLTGYSLRRSMVHISASAGWSLEQIATVVGHASTRELEYHYLEGYCGTWCRSDEGREMLLTDPRGWQDAPLNISNDAHSDSDRPRQRWWSGRDLEADRRRAMDLARSTARVGRDAAPRTALIGRKWETFCARVQADPDRPTESLLEAFAASLTVGVTANRDYELRYLSDYFAANTQIDVEDLAEIASWVSAAAALAARATAANRAQTRYAPDSRGIVHVTDAMMQAAFAVPLTAPLEALRLLGLVLDHAEPAAALTWKQRKAFCFGEHARIATDHAELRVPDTGGARPEMVLRVRASGSDPLWCPKQAVATLMEHYPRKSLFSKCPPGTLTAQCTPLIRWLQARAAVAVLYATGLRPTDLDGFRWPDLRALDDGTILWRLPYSKGNPTGDRHQVEPLVPTAEPWCPVTALRQLAESLARAQQAGWSGPAAAADSDGVVRRVFCLRISDQVVHRLFKPASLDMRPQDFRYRKAAHVWHQTGGDIQAVRSALFHRNSKTSRIYVDRGLPLTMRAETDPMANVFPDMRKPRETP